MVTFVGKLLAILVVVAVLGAAVDVTTRRLAERQLTSRVHDAIGDAGPTDAEIHSVPFLGRLLAAGDIARVRVHQEDVGANGLTFDSIDVDLRGVRIDRSQLLGHRRVELTGIDGGTVTAVIGSTEVLRIAGRALLGDVRLENGVLIIGGVRLDLAGSPLLPCATQVRLAGVSLVVTCTLHEVPKELLRDAAARLPGALAIP